jgi:hypothetical protein
MSSEGTSGNRGLPSRFQVVGTNGVGEPRVPIEQVEPGCIVRSGVDDDMTLLVLANVESVIRTGRGLTPSRKLLFYGCFCDQEPNVFGKVVSSWEQDRVFEQDFVPGEDLTVLMVP